MKQQTLFKGCGRTRGLGNNHEARTAGSLSFLMYNFFSLSQLGSVAAGEGIRKTRVCLSVFVFHLLICTLW